MTELQAAQLAIRDALRRPASRERVLALARAHGLNALAWRQRAENGDPAAATAAAAEFGQALELWHRLGMIR